MQKWRDTPQYHAVFYIPKPEVFYSDSFYCENKKGHELSFEYH